MATYPVIDSHIHLYASSHIPRLNWTAEFPSNHPLNRQNSVTEYKSATSQSVNLRGFVFLETDRKSGLDHSAWEDALDEVSFLVRIAEGTPRPDEGHATDHKDLVLAIIPWAPIPAGPGGLARYIKKVKERCGGTNFTWHKIKGFRYLMQDKTPGTMLQQDFIEGLHWLGTNGFTFDLGVDARLGGMHQLREACEMLSRLHDLGEVPRVVINHLCKPNLRLGVPEVLGGHPEFTDWKQCVKRMASFPGTYMKLSGLFSELPPQTEDHPSEIDELVMHTKPWIDVVFAAFGPTRIMFGSDWPVCNVGGPGSKSSWAHWAALVTAILDDQRLTPEEKRKVWAGTAAEAYAIE